MSLVAPFLMRGGWAQVAQVLAAIAPLHFAVLVILCSRFIDLAFAVFSVVNIDLV